MAPIRVVQYGLGPIGQEIASLVCRRPGLALVGAIDIAPHLLGRDVGEILGLGPNRTIIAGRAEEVLPSSSPDVVLHATGSSLEQVMPQIETVLEQGVSVISTCEELSWPFLRYPTLAETVDRLATTRGARVLGAGVNPGFVMDKLAITLMAACQDVRSVSIERAVDAGRRREPLQRKVGAGLSVARFEGLVADGKVRHVGLAESAHMIGHIMGLPQPTVTEDIHPVIAPQDLRTAYLEIRRGDVAGVEQVAVVGSNREEKVRLRLRMYVGAEEYDRIAIEGTPPIHVTIVGGVHGDRATAALVVNCIPTLLAAPAGLRTMVDIPLHFQAT